jgi:hypothetical protein
MNWENEARRIIRAELVRRGLTYEELATRLLAIGVVETERSIANKMSRGTFSFVFALQCMRAIGAKSISFESIDATLVDSAASSARQSY